MTHPHTPVRFSPLAPRCLSARRGLRAPITRKIPKLPSLAQAEVTDNKAHHQKVSDLTLLAMRPVLNKKHGRTNNPHTP